MTQGTLSVLLENQYQQTASWITHSLIVERQTERLLSAALDEQTSLRGYLLTEDKTFLEPYRMKAQTNFDNSFNQLQNLVKHNPTQLQKLKQLKEIWVRLFWRDEE
jgi:CHASE3 domain sensor protein